MEDNMRCRKFLLGIILVFGIAVFGCSGGNFTARFNEIGGANLANDWNVWAKYAGSSNSL
jgi:hypothetical protein